MSRIRSRDTKPEMLVRRLVHGMGYRYRLHRKDLTGCPDLAFPSRHAVIFVHGCFWHRHRGCARARLPKSKVDFWRTKLEGNRRRDEVNQEKLLAMGWRVLVIWECELGDTEAAIGKIQKFLDREAGMKNDEGS